VPEERYRLTVRQARLATALGILIAVVAFVDDLALWSRFT
jgi:hypothetical protein